MAADRTPPRRLPWPPARTTSSGSLALALVEAAGFTPTGPVDDAGRGRGVFSTVTRVPIADGSLVVKTPVQGPDGDAARLSGACAREALAYEALLPGSTVARPACHLVADHGDGGFSFVLEDLIGLRMGDQATGLTRPDAEAMVDAIAAWHLAFGPPRVPGLELRRNTPASLPMNALRAGLDHLHRFGAERLRPVLATLLDRHGELSEAFDDGADAVVTHGDPRADNAAFDGEGRAVLFDFQQLSVQLAEADLAWLAATSLTVENRRSWEDELVRRYHERLGSSAGVSADNPDGRTESIGFDRYRLGFLLPASTVLLLVQRTVDDPRAAAMVQRSVERIGAAVVDLELAAWGR